MNIFFFHLMPYGPINLEAVDKNRSAWVTLPNSEYDPALGSAIYERYLGEMALADELGFDGVCANEHHQTAYGLMPAPNLIAAALTRTTKRAKIAVLGRALPLVSNPVAVAEEFAMLDQMSGGRLITGFVRGIGSEYFASAIDPTTSHERYYEAHELILQAWTKPGPFQYHGKHYRYDYVNIWPRPVQNPHPPVWVPSQGSIETIEWCAAKERKYTYLQTFSPMTLAQKNFAAYREAAQREGYEADKSQLGWAVPTYVSDTDAKAREELKPHVETFFNYLLRFPIEMRFPPGYSSIKSTKTLIEQKFALRSVQQTVDTLIDLGIIVCGSPKTVRDLFIERCKTMNVGNILPMMQVGTQPAEQTEKSMRLFASEVMPHLRAEFGDANGNKVAAE